MKNKANRREHYGVALYLLLGLGIFLWVSMLLAVFEIWSWVLAIVYALSAGAFSSCMFEERPILKGVTLFVALEVLQFVLCGIVFLFGRLF